jgi:site-specific DNA-methyltransferase (adenine-specific)
VDTRADGVPRAVYADWLAALLRAGWSYQTTIVWHEGNVSRLSAWGSYLSASGPVVTAPVEMIIVVHRGAWVLEDKARHLTPEEWTWTSGVWQFRGASSPEHTAPFPEELPRRAIKVFSQPGATVADPFLGEGTTGWVAAELGRVFRGSDISETWVAIALDNIARALGERARAERVPRQAPVSEALAEASG